MNYKHYTRPLAAAILMAGLALAQAPGGPNAPTEPGQGRKERSGEFRKRVRGSHFRNLNLNDSQKQHAKSIFGAAREAGKPVAEQLKQSRQASFEAIKAGKSEAELDQLAANQGRLIGQMSAIHSKAFAQFYSILTPEQRQKLEEAREAGGGRMGGPWGTGFRGR
ncbi:MAG: Spy/CpxP family protein refolding chaperone [Bryobacteraceae bacterium]